LAAVRQLTLAALSFKLKLSSVIRAHTGAGVLAIHQRQHKSGLIFLKTGFISARDEITEEMHSMI